MISAAAGDWVESWLSVPRFAVYLAAAGNDRSQALALYEWNTTLAAALHHDLGHIEVGLRNAYDRALCHGIPPGGVHWVFQPERFFPQQMQRAANGRWHDANTKARSLIAEAVRAATPRPKPGQDATPPTPAPGKVIAELNFGFWRYLSAKRQASPLWVPYLHNAFPAGTGRRDVDRPVGRLHDLRNRIAHHEPLFAADLDGRYRDIITVAKLLSGELAAYVAANSRCPHLLATRPC